MAAPTGSSYSALILPKAKAAAPPKPPKGPAAKTTTRSQGVGRLPSLKGVKGSYEPSPKGVTGGVKASKPPKSEGILGKIEKVGGAVIPALASAATQSTVGPVAKPVAKALTTKAEAIGKVALKEPGGLAGRTIGEVPKDLNAMAMGSARTGLETAAEFGKTLPGGESIEKSLGINAGKPGEAAGSLVKTMSKEYVGPNARYGKSLAAEEESLKQRGLVPEITDAATVLGAGESGLMHGVSDYVGKDISGKGAAALDKVSKYRDAQTRALQSSSVQDFLNSKLPEQPTNAERRTARRYEATQPRPNARIAPGTEPVKETVGSAVRTQERSGNFLKGLRQVSKDDKLRLEQQERLRRVMETRKAAEDNPNLPAHELPQHKAGQLDYETKRGEVIPKQHTGPLGKFRGLEREQRIGSAYLHGANIRGRRGVGDAYSHEYRTLLSKASKQQKAALDWAKEGLLNLNDPEKAHAQLQEIHDQAVNGGDEQRLPLQTKQEGSAVARESGAVLDHIAKKGAESVFTPEFAKLVEMLPDETRESYRNPVLLEHPDETIARKYLPQQYFLGEWARKELEKPAPSNLHAIEVDSAEKTMAHRAQLAKFSRATRDRATGNISDAQWEAEKTRTEDTAEARDKGIARVLSARPHPDAPETKANVEQVHQLLQEGKDLRGTARAADSHGIASTDLHTQADDKFASAKNLADENARIHGLPTDRAYLPHTTTIDRESGLHVVKSRAPADYKKWTGALQKAGTLSRDPELPLRGLLRSVRDIYSQKDANEFKERFAVQLPRDDMTAKEVRDWMLKTGRNPDEFQIVHLGKARAELVDQAKADEVSAHRNTDPEAHEAAVKKIWEEAAASQKDATKGADAIPKAAWEEKIASFKQGGGFSRSMGKLKGETSKLMLGLSPKWAITMGLGTYPIQYFMGGGTAFDIAANFKAYKGLSDAEKNSFDQAFGVDSPYHTTTHGVESEHMGNTLPASLDGLVKTMQTAKASPIGRLLSKANPVKDIMALERIPRRGARIGAAMSGVKRVALEEIVREMGDGQKAINRFEVGTQKLLHVGRMPEQKYLDMALKNAPEMEKLAGHLNKMMGEWKDMTNFERSEVNKYVMFYPWVRYSIKLVTHTLPKDHPLLSSLALKLGTWQEQNLVELLGTTPEPGTVYLGKSGEAELGLKQINPTLNAATSVLSEGAGGLGELLPPYFSALIGYATKKNAFLDAPLKGAKYGESKELKKNPISGLPAFMLREALQTLPPTRALEKYVTKGRPQAYNSLPLLGLEKHVQYSGKTERKLAESTKERGSPLKILESELLPIPKSSTSKLAEKKLYEGLESKEEAKNRRKEATKKELEGEGLNPW